MSTNRIFKDTKKPVTLVNFDSISNKAASKIAKKVFESIYPTKVSPDKSEVSQGKKKLQERERQISLSPIPLKYYRDPRRIQKPLEKHLQNFSSPHRPRTHKKMVSFPNYTENTPSSSPPCLLPIDLMQVPNHCSSKRVKSLHCAALNQLATYCETFINTPLKKFDKESSKIARDNKEMHWVTKTIQKYGIYDTQVQNELVRYSNNSRHEFDKERASIVGRIKDGSFDPNQTTVKLKPRIKRKSQEFY